jgi:hypothetical protein
VNGEYSLEFHVILYSISCVPIVSADQTLKISERHAHHGAQRTVEGDLGIRFNAETILGRVGERVQSLRPKNPKMFLDSLYSLYLLYAVGLLARNYSNFALRIFKTCITPLARHSSDP